MDKLLDFDNLHKDLSVIYEATCIPMFLYRGYELLMTIPAFWEKYAPAQMYLSEIVAKRFSSPVISTNFSALYGVIPLAPEKDLYLLAGPVSQVPFTDAEYAQMHSEFRIIAGERENFVALVNAIPHHITSGFVRILNMIYYFICQGEEHPFRYNITDLIPEKMLTTSINNVYDKNSFYEANNSLAFEKKLTSIVETGSIEQLRTLRIDFSKIHAGNTSDNSVRNMKNLTIALITVLSRAAIRGGADEQITLQLSDLYIRELEGMLKIEEMVNLITTATADFTMQVANQSAARSINPDMDQIAYYIRSHTNYPLTVAYVAQIFGYSNNYLSGKFKKAMGFSLSSYIYKTKLEEAKKLLKHTEKSLVEISAYLCFSDQSHFQNLFKKQYGITPLQYRKKTRGK